MIFVVSVEMKWSRKQEGTEAIIGEGGGGEAAQVAGARGRLWQWLQ